MKEQKKITYSYDKEADVLYVSFAPGEKPTSAVELNPNILLRYNRAEGRAIGLTLLEFSALIQITKLGPRGFPLTGLKDIEPEWRETVIKILTSAPVSKVLRVSTYTPSRSRNVPITFVKKPPVSALAARP